MKALRIWKKEEDVFEEVIVPSNGITTETFTVEENMEEIDLGCHITRNKLKG